MRAQTRAHLSVSRVQAHTGWFTLPYNVLISRIIVIRSRDRHAERATPRDAGFNRIRASAAETAKTHGNR